MCTKSSVVTLTMDNFVVNKDSLEVISFLNSNEGRRIFIGVDKSGNHVGVKDSRPDHCYIFSLLLQRPCEREIGVCFLMAMKLS